MVARSLLKKPPAKKPPAKKAGGTRAGAGRPPGSRARVKYGAKADAARIRAGNVIKGNWGEEAMPELPKSATPLDVMIEAMRRAYRLGGPIAAFPFAEKAAPYLHAKISSIELRTPTPGAAAGLGTRFLVEFVKAPPPVALLPPTDVEDKTKG